MPASAIGVPGWPELAFSTPSAESIRIVWTACSINFGSYVRIAASAENEAARVGELRAGGNPSMLAFKLGGTRAAGCTVFPHPSPLRREREETGFQESGSALPLGEG